MIRNASGGLKGLADRERAARDPLLHDGLEALDDPREAFAPPLDFDQVVHLHESSTERFGQHIRDAQPGINGACGGAGRSLTSK